MRFPAVGHVDADCYVRREVAGLSVLAAHAALDRLFHQSYPRRKREEVTNRVKHSDNVPRIVTIPAGAARRRWSCQHRGGSGARVGRYGQRK